MDRKTAMAALNHAIKQLEEARDKLETSMDSCTVFRAVNDISDARGDLYYLQYDLEKME